MVQVPRRRRDVRVAELLADHADVDAFLAQLRGQRVTQAVRVDALGDPGGLARAFEHPPHVPGSIARDENRESRYAKATEVAKLVSAWTLR
jgi:hypothetical protein